MLTKLHHRVYTIEKFFLILAVLSIGLLFVFQLLHIWDGNINSTINKSLFAREDYGAKPIFSAGKITLSVFGDKNEDAPLFVLVNGEAYGKFINNQAEIIVRNHDVISIESTTNSLDSLQLKVISTTKNISFPQSNSKFSLDRSTDQLFTVEFY